jgi:hypothetical protein
MEFPLIDGLAIEQDLHLVWSQDPRVVAGDHSAKKSGGDEGGTGNALDNISLAFFVEEAVIQFDGTLDDSSAEKHSVLGGPLDAIAVGDAQDATGFDPLGDAAIFGAFDQG